MNWALDEAEGKVKAIFSTPRPPGNSHSGRPKLNSSCWLRYSSYFLLCFIKYKFKIKNTV